MKKKKLSNPIKSKQTNRPISARIPDLIVINNNNYKKKKKKTCKIIYFAVPVNHRIKLKEIEKKDKFLDIGRGMKTNMEHEGDDYTNRDWCIRYSN